MRTQRVNGHRALAKMERRARGFYIALFAQIPRVRASSGRATPLLCSFELQQHVPCDLSSAASVTARVGPVPLVAHHHRSCRGRRTSSPRPASDPERNLGCALGRSAPRQALAGLPFCDGRRASVVLSESGGARRLGHDGGFPAVRAVVGTSAFGIGNGGGRFE